jgi:hypothetical protein
VEFSSDRQVVTGGGTVASVVCCTDVRVEDLGEQSVTSSGFKLIFPDRPDGERFFWVEPVLIAQVKFTEWLVICRASWAASLSLNVQAYASHLSLK